MNFNVNFNALLGKCIVHPLVKIKTLIRLKSLMFEGHDASASNAVTGEREQCVIHIENEFHSS